MAGRLHQTLVVGGGPAGTAMLIAATRTGMLGTLARQGLVVVERGEALGRGALGGYAITSDSTAETFLTAVRDNPHPGMAALASAPETRAVAEWCGKFGVPLEVAGRFLARIGDRLHELVEEEGGTVLTGHEALETTRGAQGVWTTRLRRPDGGVIDLASRNVVIATGGHQPWRRILDEVLCGETVERLCGAKVMRSDTLLAQGGLARAASRLPAGRTPRIVVLGGSTSAISAANALLKDRARFDFAPGGLTVIHRRPLRPFYPSREAALADGFDDFTDDDICPVSKFVYRLGGFRLEARELVLDALAIGGRTPDPRLRLHRLGDPDPTARALIEEADLVVAALGYRPRALPVHEASGQKLPLFAEGAGAPPMVDGSCRVLGHDRAPIPGLFGIGLAAGFVPHGKFGGEKSFRGQANGLWLWQNDVGAAIVEQLTAAEPERAVA
jgi:hypothetical protein